VLNKVEDAGPARADAARKIIKALNPDAQLIETTTPGAARARSSTPGCSISTGRMSIRSGRKELYGFADHVPETEEYGVRPSSTGRAGRSIRRRCMRC
jgi:G3E family GTPase